jgi:hypothetical protein
VSFSPALRWSVAILLVLTLGWKWVTDSYIRADQGEPEEKVAERVAGAFLIRNHFNLVGSREVVFGMQLLEASAGPCRIRLALASSRGWHRDLIQGMVTPGDSTFVVFGGNVYSEQPMWRTVPDFLWFKFLSALGLRVHSTPVITVIATPNCEAERLPWKELR